MPNRLKILILLLLIVLGAGGFWYFNSFQKLTISLDAPVQAKVFKASHGEEGPGYDSKAPIKEVASGQTIKLKRGDYLIVSQPSDDYSQQILNISLKNSRVDVKVNPDYTSHKLNVLFNAEQANITKTIVAKYSNFASLYKVGEAKLYKKGEWCGVKLTPLDPKQDIRKIILKKDSGAWLVVTDPPPIVIGAPIYPDIPKEIISDVNNFL